MEAAGRKVAAAPRDTLSGHFRQPSPGKQHASKAHPGHLLPPSHDLPKEHTWLVVWGLTGLGLAGRQPFRRRAAPFWGGRKAHRRRSRTSRGDAFAPSPRRPGLVGVLN